MHKSKINSLWQRRRKLGEKVSTDLARKKKFFIECLPYAATPKVLFLCTRHKFESNINPDIEQGNELLFYQYEIIFTGALLTKVRKILRT